MNDYWLYFNIIVTSKIFINDKIKKIILQTIIKTISIPQKKIINDKKFITNIPESVL